MKYILVYADTVDELKEKIVDENLAYVIVNDDCVNDYMDKNGYDKEKWLNEYTADDTIDFYDYVIQNGQNCKIVWYDKNQKEKGLLSGANTIWYMDDIAAALEYYEIDPTKENIDKIATPDFVRGFHDRLVEYGNEMIADKVREVFDK